MLLKFNILIFCFCLFNTINCNFVYPKVLRDENLINKKFGIKVIKQIY